MQAVSNPPICSSIASTKLCGERLQFHGVFKAGLSQCYSDYDCTPTGSTLFSKRVECCADVVSTVMANCQNADYTKVTNTITTALAAGATWPMCSNDPSCVMLTNGGLNVIPSSVAFTIIVALTVNVLNMVI